MKHALIIVGILALAYAGYWLTKRGSTPTPAASEIVSPAPTPTPSVSSTPAPAASRAAKPKATATPKPSALQAVETYQDALKIYSASGYRFQFSDCKVSPGTLTMKVGTKFMLDNRDAQSRVIGIGAKIYNIGAYGFVVTAAPSSAGTYYITCNGGGTGNIVVQP